jgi:hypothetical protein
MTGALDVHLLYAAGWLVGRGPMEIGAAMLRADWLDDKSLEDWHSEKTTLWEVPTHYKQNHKTYNWITRHYLSRKFYLKFHYVWMPETRVGLIMKW